MSNGVIPQALPKPRTKALLPTAANGSAAMEVQSLVKGLPPRAQGGPATSGTSVLTTGQILDALTAPLGNPTSTGIVLPPRVQTKPGAPAAANPNQQAAPMKLEMPPAVKKVAPPNVNGIPNDKVLGMALPKAAMHHSLSMPAGMPVRRIQMSLTGVPSVAQTVGAPPNEDKAAFAAKKPAMPFAQPPVSASETKAESSMDTSSDAAKKPVDSKRSTAGKTDGSTGAAPPNQALPVIKMKEPHDELDVLLSSPTPAAPAATPAAAPVAGAAAAATAMDTGADSKSGKEEKSGKDEKVVKSVPAPAPATASAAGGSLDDVLGGFSIANKNTTTAKPAPAQASPKKAPAAVPLAAATAAAADKPAPPPPSPSRAKKQDKPKPVAGLRAAHLPPPDDAAAAAEDRIATVAPPASPAKPKPKPAATPAAPQKPAPMEDDGDASDEFVKPKKKSTGRQRITIAEESGDKGGDETKTKTKDEAKPKKETEKAAKKETKKEAAPPRSPAKPRKAKEKQPADEEDPERTASDEEPAEEEEEEANSKRSRGGGGKKAKAKAKAKGKKPTYRVTAPKQWYISRFIQLYEDPSPKAQLKINKLLDRAGLSRDDIKLSHVENKKPGGVWSRLYDNMSVEDSEEWRHDYAKFKEFRIKQMKEQDEQCAAEVDAEESSKKGGAAMDTSSDAKSKPKKPKKKEQPKKSKKQPAAPAAAEKSSKSAAPAKPKPKQTQTQLVHKPAENGTGKSSGLQLAVRENKNASAVAQLQNQLHQTKEVTKAAALFAEANKNKDPKLSFMKVVWQTPGQFTWCKFEHPKHGDSDFVHALRVLPAQIDVAGGIHTVSARELLRVLAGNMRYAGRCVREIKLQGIDGKPIVQHLWSFLFRDSKDNWVTPIPDANYQTSMQLACALCSSKNVKIKNMNDLAERVAQLELAQKSKWPLVDSYVGNALKSYREVMERNGGIPMELDAVMDPADTSDDDFIDNDDVPATPAKPKRGPKPSESKSSASSASAPAVGPPKTVTPAEVVLDLSADEPEPALAQFQSVLAKLASAFPDMLVKHAEAVQRVNEMLVRMLDPTTDVTADFKQFAESQDEKWATAAADVSLLVAVVNAVTSDIRWSVQNVKTVDAATATAMQAAAVADSDAEEEEEDRKLRESDKQNNKLASAAVKQGHTMLLVAGLAQQDAADERGVGGHMAVRVGATKKLEKAAKEVYRKEQEEEQQGKSAKRVRSKFVNDSAKEAPDEEEENEAGAEADDENENEDENEGRDEENEAAGSEPESDDTSDEGLSIECSMSYFLCLDEPKSSKKANARKRKQPEPKNKKAVSFAADTEGSPSQKRRKLTKTDKKEAQEQATFDSEFPEVQQGTEKKEEDKAARFTQKLTVGKLVWMHDGSPVQTTALGPVAAAFNSAAATAEQMAEVEPAGDIVDSAAEAQPMEDDQQQLQQQTEECEAATVHSQDPAEAETMYEATSMETSDSVPANSANQAQSQQQQQQQEEPEVDYSDTPIE